MIELPGPRDADASKNSNKNIGLTVIVNAYQYYPSTSWSLLPMSSVEQTSEAQLLLSLPKAKLTFFNL